MNQANKRSLLIVCIIGLTMIVTLFVIIFEIASTASNAEHAYTSMQIATLLVEEYVRTHSGEWPTSWDDLTPILSFRFTTGQTSINQIRKYVHIDFFADPDSLQFESPDNFRAIQRR